MPPHADASAAAAAGPASTVAAARAAGASGAPAAARGQVTWHQAKLSRLGGEWAPVIAGRTQFATASADPAGPSSICRRFASLLAATPSEPPVEEQTGGHLVKRPALAWRGRVDVGFG